MEGSQALHNSLDVGAHESHCRDITEVRCSYLQALLIYERDQPSS